MIFRWNPFAIECFYREWVFFILEKQKWQKKKKTFRQPTYSKPQISQDNKYLRITVPIFIPQHTHTHTHTHTSLYSLTQWMDLTIQIISKWESWGSFRLLSYKHLSILRGSVLWSLCSKYLSRLSPSFHPHWNCITLVKSSIIWYSGLLPSLFNWLNSKFNF